MMTPMPLATVTQSADGRLSNVRLPSLAAPGLVFIYHLQRVSSFQPLIHELDLQSCAFRLAVSIPIHFCCWLMIASLNRA